MFSIKIISGRWLPVRKLSRHASTIFGLSSGYGKCGVAVIRVSGANTRQALNSLTSLAEIPPRVATLRSLKHPKSKIIIDKGLVLWFPGPKSFTGEDSCEFQVHGGSAIISAMLDALSNIDDCRPALPGEFTKRAFYAGKLDLTEVEGLADLIHAETEAQRRQALLQANGVQSNLYNKWRKEILKNVAHLEAFIDFSEDENIEDGVMEQVMSSICTLENEVKAYLKDGRKGERLKSGVRTVILGAPNVGKSSLINILCQRPISIVTNIAGTTRDLIETHYNIAGFPVVLADTAGLRLTTSDPIEAEGITRAKAFTLNADLLVFMMDATKYVKYVKETAGNCNFENYVRTYMESLGLEFSSTLEKKILYIMNKADLLKKEELVVCEESTATVVSCLHNTGIKSCVNKMSNILEELCGNPSEECPSLSHARHRHHLEQCVKNLMEYRQYLNTNNENQDLAIAAQKLRTAMRCIGKIIGEVCTEDVLDVIFKDFCIGK